MAEQAVYESYKATKKAAKKEVAKAKAEHRKMLGERLDLGRERYLGLQSR